MTIWGISGDFSPLYPCYGQVAYALRTRAPVAARVLLPRAAPRLACVKLPLAFILSQDQTLHCKNCFFTFDSSVSHLPTLPAWCLTHAISCFKIIQCSLASLVNIVCFLESECKDTTFFQTEKIFFLFFLHFGRNELIFKVNFFSFFCHTPRFSSAKCLLFLENSRFLGYLVGIDC